MSLSEATPFNTNDAVSGSRLSFLSNDLPKSLQFFVTFVRSLSETLAAFLTVQVATE